MTNKENLQTFEKQLAKLEKVVKKLESGGRGLGESLADFEQGALLYNECKSLLEMAQGKVVKLTQLLEEKPWGHAEED